MIIWWALRSAEKVISSLIFAWERSGDANGLFQVTRISIEDFAYYFTDLIDSGIPNRPVEDLGAPKPQVTPVNLHL